MLFIHIYVRSYNNKAYVNTYACMYLHLKPSHKKYCMHISRKALHNILTILNINNLYNILQAV